MTNTSFEEGKKLKDLESEIKLTLDQFRKPSTSNFAIDGMMTIVTKNYMEYLRLSVENEVPIKEVKSVTENYLQILNEYTKRE